MPIETPLDYFPLWIVFFITLSLVLLAFYSGSWFGQRKRRCGEKAQEGLLGEIVAGMLGLLAFMLAFTYGLGASRLENRKGLVLDEANAISTAWLRAGLLSDPHRSEIRKLLRDYLEVRITSVQSGKILEGMGRSEELQRQLWAHAADLGKQEGTSIVVGLFITSLNEVIDLHSKRVAHGLRNRIPASIWLALYFLAIVSIGDIGYHAGLEENRKLHVIIPLVLAISAVLLLIVDLDRPQEGLLRVSQESLTDLRVMMTD
jgi:CDP-diglyceride synthetase